MSLKLKVKTSHLLAGLIAVPFLMAPLVVSASSVPATAKVNTTKLNVTDKFVYVGQLHSATGTMAISETGAKTRSTDIINKATRELGIRKNSNKYLNFVLSITNQSSLTAYATDPREILAFSLESEATKRPLNEMAQKVVDIFWREYGK